MRCILKLQITQRKKGPTQEVAKLQATRFGVKYNFSKRVGAHDNGDLGNLLKATAKKRIQYPNRSCIYHTHKSIHDNVNDMLCTHCKYQ